MKNIILTGFMASGKTTVGTMLAKILGYRFCDTDEMIEKKENRTINDIFATHGEKYFRKLENEISKEFIEVENTVISTGGGFVLNPENIENIRKNAVVFNLNVSDSVVVSRYEKAKLTRPLMCNDSVDNILKRYSDRKEFYKNCDFMIEIGNDTITPEEICNIIIEKYKSL